MPGGGVYYTWRSCLLYVDISSIAESRHVQDDHALYLAEAAAICEHSGCDGITVRLRRDTPYVEEKILFAIKDRTHGRLNLKMALSDERVDMAKKFRPDRITLIPETGIEKIPAGGLDVRKDRLQLMDKAEWFHDQDIGVSFFVEPDMEAIALSKECGADFIGINTWRYGHAKDQSDRDKEIRRIYSAAEHAVAVGIKISAGHGLDYKNIMPVLKTRALEEVHIGQSIATRSGAVGLSKAVKELLEFLD